MISERRSGGDPLRLACPSCNATVDVDAPGVPRCPRCGAALPRVESLARPEAPAAAVTEVPAEERGLPPETERRAQALEAQLREKPGARALYLQLAQLYGDAGRKDLAADALRRGLTADPGNVTMKARLELLERPAGTPSRAIITAPAEPPLAGPAVPPRAKRAALLVAAALAGIAALLVLKATLFPATRLLVASERGSVHAPRFSPDGQHVAFLASTDRGQEIRIVDVSSREIRTVATTTGWGPDSFAWSPDGQKIAFVSSPRALTGTGDGGAASGDDEDEESWDEESFDASSWQEAVFVVDVDGGEPRRIAAGEGPVWSPDGMRLALTSWGPHGPRGDEEGPSLHVANVVTGGVDRVSSHPARRYSFSPDGRSIVFESTKIEERDAEALAGGTDDDPASFAEGALSADPTTFAGARSGIQREFEARQMDARSSLGAALGPSDIFLVPSGGGPASRVTTNRRSEAPRFTPEGDAIVFLSQTEAGHVEILSMPGSGRGQPTTVVSGAVQPFDTGGLRVGPDGRVVFVGIVREANAGVAMTMTGSLPADVYVARTGKKPRRVENRHTFKQGFDLSPDGRRIVYEVHDDEGGSEIWIAKL